MQRKTLILIFCNFSRILSLTVQDLSNSTKPFLILKTASGNKITVHVQTEDLQNEEYFDASDPVVAAHIHGLWLFYADKSFNWADDKPTNGKVEWVYNTDPAKRHQFSSDIQSFRKPGDPDDFSKSTFNLFMGLNFTGPADMTEVTEPYNIPFAKAKSLIITGPEPWFLYTSANFVQKTLCVHPSWDMHIALVSDYYLNPFTRPLRHISSATRNGCTNSTRTHHLFYQSEPQNNYI